MSHQSGARVGTVFMCDPPLLCMALDAGNLTRAGSEDLGFSGQEGVKKLAEAAGTGNRVRLRAGWAPRGFGGLRWVPCGVAGSPGGCTGCEGGWRSGEEGLAGPAVRPLLLLRSGLKGCVPELGRRERRERSGRQAGAELLPLPSFPSSGLPVLLSEVTGLIFPS